MQKSIDEIKSYGFQENEILPKKFWQSSFVERTDRGSILYGWPSHYMKREVLSFSLKK